MEDLVPVFLFVFSPLLILLYTFCYVKRNANSAQHRIENRDDGGEEEKEEEERDEIKVHGQRRRVNWQILKMRMYDKKRIGLVVFFAVSLLLLHSWNVLCAVFSTSYSS